ncbi:HisA/HisF-related TIM barrel protein [Candidatus Pelagibacter ubique]|nr:HisA/HisF-related TIM barrel protein [Candidatus Pelagibacter ubique]
MHPVRIIAKIDIKDNSIVKGISLEGLRKLGDPYDFAKYYFENNIDEIIFHDVTASLFGNNCLTKIIDKVCNNLFIPITIGGGLRNLKDIENILKRGADRVMLNSAVVKNISFLDKAVKSFGSSNIAINVEYREIDGKYLVFYEYGRQPTKMDLFEWIKKVENTGAGEIVLTSIDKEGYGKGFDYNVIKKLENICKIPITIHGGCSSINHIDKIFKYSKKISGIALSSILHYNYLKKNNILNLPISNKWENCSIKLIKKKISKNNILIRK